MNTDLKLLSIFNENIEKTPLQKMKSCQITKDGKYIVFEGKAYFTKTGDQVPLNEEWTLSDIFHTGADLVSAGMDFIIPGSGAVVDILNAISYVIEAQFKPEEERDSLYLMAVVTMGFVVLPGPIQAVAVPLKNFLKGGVKVATPAVKTALGFIYKSLDTILGGALTQIELALKSNFAKRILSKFNKQTILGYFGKFKTRIKDLLSRLLPANVKAGATVAKVGIKNTIDKIAKTKLITFIKGGFKVSKGSMLLKKLGFVPGRTYKFTSTAGKVYQATIRKYTDDFVELSYKGANNKSFVNSIKITEFANHAIGAPWMRRGYSVTVPLFIKRFTDFLSDNGMIDINKMMSFGDLNPDDTARETQELAGYEGDSGQYSINPTVQSFQQALILLGYKLKGNDDGKFGPSTKQSLEDFQKNNGLESSLGKMDRYSANKLAEVLNTKKPQGKFNYTNVANSLIELTKKS